MDYKNFHREVISKQHTVRDYLDDASHAQARELVSLFQKLEDDVQMQKNPLTIRDLLKRIESKLLSLDDKVMSNGHSDELNDWVRDCLKVIR